MKSDFVWINLEGEEAQSLYTWVLYSANNDGKDPYTEPQADTEYMGVRYNNKLEQANGGADASDPTKYHWINVKGLRGISIKGDKGEQGARGFDGRDGRDGKDISNWVWVTFGREDRKEVSVNPENSTHVYLAFDKVEPTPYKRRLYKRDFNIKLPIDAFVQAPRFTIRFTDNIRPYDLGDGTIYKNGYIRDSKTAFLINNYNAPVSEKNEHPDIKAVENVHEGLYVHSAYENLVYPSDTKSLTLLTSGKRLPHDPVSWDGTEKLHVDGFEIKLNKDNRRKDSTVIFDDTAVLQMKGHTVWVSFVVKASSKNCMYEIKTHGLNKTDAFVVGQLNYSTKHLKVVTANPANDKLTTGEKARLGKSEIQFLNNDCWRVMMPFAIPTDSKFIPSIKIDVFARQFDSNIINESNRSVDLHFWGLQVTNTMTPMLTTIDGAKVAKGSYWCEVGKSFPTNGHSFHMSLDVAAFPTEDPNDLYRLLIIMPHLQSYYGQTNYPFNWKENPNHVFEQLTDDQIPMEPSYFFRQGNQLGVNLHMYNPKKNEPARVILAADMAQWSPVIITVEFDRLTEKAILYLAGNKVAEKSIKDLVMGDFFDKYIVGGLIEKELGTFRVKEFSIYDGLFVGN